MGHPFFICESGTGNSIAADKRAELDAYVRTALRSADWGWADATVSRASYGLSYFGDWLEVVVYHLSGTDKEELRNLVAFARSLGLNLFVDVGSPEDEMDLEDMERLVGPLT